MFRLVLAIDLAKRVLDLLARALAPKESQSRNSQISSQQSKDILYDTAPERVLLNAQVFRAQTIQVLDLDKKHQT